MSASRRFSVSQDQIELRPKLGEAVYLLDFFTDHQTSADGWVYYGRDFGYAWIKANWINAPPLGTMKRHMRTLKDLGLVETRRVLAGGMRVRLLRSVKFAKAIPPPATQLSLFKREVIEIGRKRAVGNPVEKLWKSCESPAALSLTGETKAVSLMEPERSTALKVLETRKSDAAAADAASVAEETPDEAKARFMARLRDLAASKTIPDLPRPKSDEQLAVERQRLRDQVEAIRKAAKA